MKSDTIQTEHQTTNKRRKRNDEETKNSFKYQTIQSSPQQQPSTEKGLVEMMKSVLDKKRMSILIKILQQLIQDKNITKLLIPIQELFDYDQLRIDSSRACILKLGSAIPPQVQAEYFAHFERVFDSRAGARGNSSLPLGFVE